MQLLIFFVAYRQISAPLSKRQLKHNTIYKKYCQAFLKKIYNFFYIFLFFCFLPLYIIFMSRARKKKKRRFHTVLLILIYSHYTFYSCPNTFSTAFPWRKTCFPNSRAPPFLRSQGIAPRPCAILPARQIFFRMPRICTVKKALYALLIFSTLIIPPNRHFCNRFIL